MTTQSTGRFGLLSTFVLLLAGIPASAALLRAEPVPGLEQDQDDAKRKAMEDKKKAAIEQKKKQVEAVKRQGGGVTRGGGVVGDQVGRQGADVDENAKLDIEFGSENFNFGQVTQGELLEHTFVMTAGGSSDLVIRQAKPTCGCTVSDVLVEQEGGEFAIYGMGDPIKPGKKIKISAAMDTKNKSNKAEVRINVYTNDQVGLYQLGLSAQVEPFMTVQPSYLQLGDLSEDTVREEKMMVRTSRGQKVKLDIDESLPRPKPPGMDFILSPVDPDEEGRSSQWQVLVKVGPGLKEGQVGYAMRLISDVEVAGGKDGDGHAADDGHGHGHDDGHGHDHAKSGKPQFYQVSANVGGRVLGVLSVSPQYLSMGLVRPGQPVSRSVRIVANDPSIDLSDIKARVQGAAGGAFPWSGHFTSIVRPVEGQSQAVDVELRLDGLPEGSEGSFKGEMIVETGSKAKPEMKVTFSGVCRAGVGRSTK